MKYLNPKRLRDVYGDIYIEVIPLLRYGQEGEYTVRTSRNKP